MNEIVEKLRKLEEALAAEKGPFRLFAVFLRANAPGVWDVVVAADWIDKDRVKALDEIAPRVRDSLGPKHILKISRVVIIDATNPALKALTGAFSVEHGVMEVSNSEFFGLEIEHGYIITSKLRQAA